MKLVLTGGPSGGKTTVSEAISREFTSKVWVIPEAASIIYGGGWPRRTTEAGVKHQQKAIYFVQRELEAMLAEEHPDRLIICDRGSLDGAAYWPNQTDPMNEFLRAVGSDLKTELARYDFVIHMDTAPQSAYDLTNSLRNESFAEAWVINQRTRNAWSGHAHRFIIESLEGDHFRDKLDRALSIVEKIVTAKS